MTARSVIIAMLLVVFLSAVTFLNDTILQNTYLIGNFLPVGVVGTLILFLLLINPLLGRISKRLALSGRELAVIVAITYFSCFIPGGGLLHVFTNVLMWPHKREVSLPAWQGEPPEITANEVADWPRILTELKRFGMEGKDLPGGRVWERLPDDLKSAIGARPEPETRIPEVAFQDNVLSGLNRVLEDRTLYDPEAFDGVPLKWHLKLLLGRGLSTLTQAEIDQYNRGLLDALFEGALTIRRPGVLDNLPPVMLTDVRDAPIDAPNRFAEGIADDKGRMAFSKIPWQPWIRTFLFWIPLVLTMCIAVTGLALVLHRQWTSHEHLPYPTVEFIRTLLPEEGRAGSAILRNRLFWIGTLFVLGIHMINYANRWWPNDIMSVRITLDFSPLIKLIPLFKGEAGWNEYYLGPSARIYFMAVGFAYFLATDVSLSLGIAAAVYQVVICSLAVYGIALPLEHLEPTADAGVYTGAYVGLLLVLIYTGRQYYRSVFQRSLFLPTRDLVEPYAVWGARVFLAFTALFIVQLTVIGVEWQIAILYTMGCLLIYVVVSRLLAEAGIFFIRTYFAPCALLWGFMGAKALGPDQLVMLSFVTIILASDPREAMMPFVVSGIELVERARVKVGRTAAWGIVALFLAVAVGVPTVLYIQYRNGSTVCGGWWLTHFPSELPFNVNTEVRQTLAAKGSLDEAQSLSGWQRFAHLTPRKPYMIGFSITLCVVLLFSFLRYRFAGWPFHPILFVMLGTWASVALGSSFLIGWAIKAAVTKYGGVSLYQKLKPLMFGLVAGDVLASIITLIIGAIYYIKTGEAPRYFRVTPT